VVAKLSQYSDISSERVRVYGNNASEILPSEVGRYREKEPEATETPWSVKEPGIYALFYFIVHDAEESRESELRNTASEFTGCGLQLLVVRPFFQMVGWFLEIELRNGVLCNWEELYPWYLSDGYLHFDGLYVLNQCVVAWVWFSGVACLHQVVA
jgi:hypothetical protein